MVLLFPLLKMKNSIQIPLLIIRLPTTTSFQEWQSLLGERRAPCGCWGQKQEAATPEGRVGFCQGAGGPGTAPGGSGHCESQFGLGISPGDQLSSGELSSAPPSVACCQRPRIIVCLKFYQLICCTKLTGVSIKHISSLLEALHRVTWDLTSVQTAVAGLCLFVFLWVRFYALLELKFPCVSFIF